MDDLVGPQGPPGRTSYKALIGYLILASAMIFGLWKVETTSRQNKETICDIKMYAEAQVKATKTFIENHPQGIEGITILELYATLQRQQDFAASFREHECN